jgi:CdiI immunity protein
MDWIARRQFRRRVPLVDGQRPRDRWPALFQFFGGYLHQDFDMDGRAKECVLKAIVDSDIEGLAEVASNLRELRAQGWSDDAIGRALSDLGMQYFPYADDLTSREWVEWVYARVVERAGIGLRSDAD